MNELAFKKEYFEIHEGGLYDWDRVFNYINMKRDNINGIINSKWEHLDNLNNEKQDIIQKKLELENELELLKQREIQITKENENVEKFLKEKTIPINIIDKIRNITEEIINDNNEIYEKVHIVLEESENLQNPISEEALKILFKKMNLVKFYDIAIENNWHTNIMNINENDCDNISMNCRDKCCFLYNIEMMKHSNHLSKECLICEHDTPIKTVELLEEYGKQRNIEFNKQIILKENWISPYLLFLQDYDKIGIKQTQYDDIRKLIKEWKQIHYKI